MSSVRLHTAYSSPGVKNYFNTADYYQDGPETQGFYAGRLCRVVGVKPGDPVAKDDFGLLCDNINPATGKRLTLRTNEFRRVGEDMIFSLEKDLSVLIMRAPPELRAELLAMVQRRVLEVCGVIEGDVETRMRKDGAFMNRPGDGLLFTGWLHTTARAVKGFAPDPQIHWHMFAFNATQDGEEGRVKAADFAKIYANSGYYDALFNAMVAHDFARLGLPVVNYGKGRFGIEGMEWAKPLFSKRTGYIEEEARRLNITDAGEKNELGAKTRLKKDKTLSPSQLEAAWDGQMTPEQRETLERLHRIIAEGGGEPMPPAVTAGEAVAFAIAHCSEKLAVIPERELMKTALLHGLGSVTPDMIEAELLSPAHGLVFDTIKGEKVVTTEALKAEEREMASEAWHGLGQAVPVGLSPELDRSLENGKKLNDEQWAAVTGLLESPNRINVVTGPAGAGKSKLLRKYDEGVSLTGGKVTYLASTGQAAEVLKGDGFDCRTVSSFLLSGKQQQQAAKGGRVVVDETSILGHKEARQLLRLGKDLNLKFVFVGDPMQHGSVSRGAFMRLLTEKGTLKPIKLTRILRQKDPAYRNVAQLFADGRAVEGFDALHKMGWVLEIADHAERARRIAGDYVESLRDGHRWQDVLVIAPTHAEADAITGEIRSRLKDAGRLGEEREFSRLAAVDTSEAERGQASTYRPGDVLVFHQNAKGGFTKGDRITVTDPAKVPLAAAGKFSVYREQTINVAAGDVLRFTGTVQAMGKNPRVFKNGMAARVAGFTEAGNIRLDTGDVIGKDAAMFRHGFVETSIGSQGRTVRRVLLGMSAAMGKAANMQQLYVSSTRAWEWVRVYADDAATVRQAAERDSRQLLALDVKPGLSEAEKRRLEDVVKRSQARRAAEIAASQEKAWGTAWGPEPPAPPLPPLPPLGYAGKLAARRQQEQGMRHGR